MPLIVLDGDELEETDWFPPESVIDTDSDGMMMELALNGIQASLEDSSWTQMKARIKLTTMLRIWSMILQCLKKK